MHTAGKYVVANHITLAYVHQLAVTQHKTTVSACLLQACARYTTQINAPQSYPFLCSGSACGCSISFHSVVVDFSLLVIKLIRAFGSTLGV